MVFTEFCCFTFAVAVYRLLFNDLLYYLVLMMLSCLYAGNRNRFSRSNCVDFGIDETPGDAYDLRYNDTNATRS